MGHFDCEGTGIGHVALCVRDLDEATDFYCRQLGLTEATNRPNFDFRGAWIDAGAHQIHLVETPSAVPDRRQHVALVVDDLASFVAELEGRGVAVDRRALTPGAGYQAFVRDPTGNRVELNQPDR